MHARPDAATPPDGRRYVFAGNRSYVLDTMRDLGLAVATVFAPPQSYLARVLTERGIDFVPMESKAGIIEALRAMTFDVFVSNGCPYILPVTALQAGTDRAFINIHPSYLPDLRGADPVPGALLHGRRSGATCHVMNDLIDAGDIIARVPIDLTDGLDCGLLYQMSFLAEQEAFRLAYARGFAPALSQEAGPDDLYYTIQDADLRIDFSASLETIVRTIRAFDTRSRGAFFERRGLRVKVRDVEVVDHPFLRARFGEGPDGEVVIAYEQRLLVRKAGRFLKLKQLDGDIAAIRPGDVLD